MSSLSFSLSGPKTLAERLQWMADNLPGFREELEAVNEISRRQLAKRCAVPARSEARTATAQRAAQSTTVDAYTPRVIRG